MTGVDYVSKIRFQNDDVWQAELDFHCRSAEKIESDFDVSKLKEEKRQ